MKALQLFATGLFLTLVAAVVLSTCSSPPQDPPVAEAAEISPTQREADIQAILEFEQALFDAENAGDLQAWLGLIDPDPVWMPPNEPMIYGLQAIRQWAAPFFEQYDLHEETTDREVEVAGDWGYIRAHWTWTVTPKAGGGSVTDSGKSIWILRRQGDGSWRLARAIWNSDNPAPPAVSPEQ